MATILSFYGFHISQMSPMGMVRVRHFEFLCWSHGLEPDLAKFRAMYQLIRNMGFYSFAQQNDVPVPKKEAWCVRLTTTPNRIFGQHVLVAAGMSDRWPARSEEISVLLFNGEEIKNNFSYPPAGIFANPPTATEGVHRPNPKPLRAVTSAGKEIFYLSSEESLGSSNGELSSWSSIFPGVLRNLGIDLEEKKKKASTKKKITKRVVTVDTGATSKKTGGSRATAVASEKGEKKKISATASKSSRSAGYRALESGTTLSSILVDEEEEEEEECEEEEEEEEATKLVTRKTLQEETAAGAPPAQKPIVGPAIGKQSRLRSLYKFSPGDRGCWGVDCHCAGAGLDQPFKRKEPEVVKPTQSAQHDAPTQTLQVTSVDGGSTATVLEQTTHRDTTAVAAGAGAEPIWGLKQKDTLVEFGTCRDWYLGSFPPGEVNRQRARTHEGLYHAYIVGRIMPVLPTTRLCASGAQCVKSGPVGRSTGNVF
ncbi:hypothetical protein Hanom_Chr09g00783991 [Helianthus anomalus]